MTMTMTMTMTMGRGRGRSIGVGGGAGICLEREPEISKMAGSGNPGFLTYRVHITSLIC